MDEPLQREDSNYLVFRECLSAVIVERTDSQGQKKKNTKTTRKKKSKKDVESTRRPALKSANDDVEVDLLEESVNVKERADPEELADFVDV